MCEVLKQFFYTICTKTIQCNNTNNYIILIIIMILDEAILNGEALNLYQEDVLCLP